MTRAARVPWKLGVASVVSGAVLGGVITDRAMSDRMRKLEQRMERLEQDQLRVRTWVSALHALVWTDDEPKGD